VRGLFRWYRDLSPHAFFVASFAVLIAIGALGLRVLPALHTGARVSSVDAVFTMTSAVCVTGLTVVDTATTFTFWGQLWILVFIQLGGLGLVSLGSMIIAALGARLSLRTEMIALPMRSDGHSDAVSVLVATAKLVFGVEAIGALVLFFGFLPHYPAGASVWHAIFHSVSAFCNAGFSTFSTNLMEQAGRPWILVPISLLVVVGGIGYLATEEVIRWWKAGGRRAPRRLSSHTFSVLTTTLALLVGGAALFTIFEGSHSFADLSIGDRISNGWFMSVTARTAGFNTVPYVAVGNHAIFLTILLMIVGGSPGSTAGGIKTTSLAVLVALAAARVRGRRHVELHDRTVPEGTLERTVSLVLLATVVILVGAFTLDLTETTGLAMPQARQSVLPLAFEIVSAFGTVGLSMDVTPTLSVPGRMLIIVMMFIGRVGPLAFFAAISFKTSRVPARTRAAREDLVVG
jgi:trk system potassium uptake protein